MEQSDFTIYKKDGDVFSMGFEFKNLLKTSMVKLVFALK